MEKWWGKKNGENSGQLLSLPVNCLKGDQLQRRPLVPFRETVRWSGQVLASFVEESGYLLVDQKQSINQIPLVRPVADIYNSCKITQLLLMMEHRELLARMENGMN